MSIATERPLVFRGVSGGQISSRVQTIRCLAQHGGLASISELSRALKLSYHALCDDLRLLQAARLVEVYDHAGHRHVRIQPPGLTPLSGEGQTLWAQLWAQWTRADPHAPVSHLALTLLLGWDRRRVARLLHELAGRGWLELRMVGRKTILAAPSMRAIVASLREGPEWGRHQQQVEAIARAGALLEEAQRALSCGDASVFLGRVDEAHDLLSALSTRARPRLPEENAAAVQSAA